jgi:hypothetical protein
MKVLSSVANFCDCENVYFSIRGDRTCWPFGLADRPAPQAPCFLNLRKEFDIFAQRSLSAFERQNL